MTDVCTRLGTLREFVTSWQSSAEFMFSSPKRSECWLTARTCSLDAFLTTDIDFKQNFCLLHGEGWRLMRFSHQYSDDESLGLLKKIGFLVRVYWNNVYLCSAKTNLHIISRWKDYISPSFTMKKIKILFEIDVSCQESKQVRASRNSYSALGRRT